MDVDQGKGMSRGKKGRFRTGKGKHRGESKGKSKGRRPGPCLLCQGPLLHIILERANVLYHLAKDTRTLHRFDKLLWKVTDATGSQVQVPLQFGSHLCRILQVVDLQGNSGNLRRCRSSIDFTSRATTSFLLRERSRGRVHECFACSLPALESDF